MTANSLQGLVWSDPGFRINTDGIGYAYAPFAVGTQAFDLTAKIHLDQADYAEWRTNGFYIGLGSQSQPNMGSTYMGSTAVCAVTAFLREGPSPAFRGYGNPYWPQTASGYGQYTRWIDSDIPARHVLNYGGEGGHEYARAWPSPYLDSTDWTIEIKRDTNNVLTYNLYYADYTSPWLSESYTLPATAPGGLTPATTPLNYLIIGKARDAADYTDAALHTVSPTNAQMSGWITDIQARTLDTPMPALTGFTASNPVVASGSTVTLLGQNLDSNATITVGGLAATGITPVTGGLQFTVPAGLPATPRQTVTLTNANGLHTDLTDGLPLGRVITRFDEREVRPEGGDIVTLIGGGFDAGTVIKINNQPATIVQLIDSSHVSIQVPAGTTGMTTVTATSGGNTFTGTPQLAYAPHSTLFYKTPAELQALRDKFNFPQFANYKTLLLHNADTLVSGKYDMNSVLWAYLLTNDVTYKNRLLPLIQTEAQSIDHYQFAVMNAVPMAAAYDTLFGELDNATKAQMQKYLDSTVTLYNQVVSSQDWWYANGANPSNTINVGAGGSGMAALVLRNSSTAAATAVTNAVNSSKNYYKALGSDGGCVEGTLYWNYGLTPQLVLGHSLQTATGSDSGLLDTTALRNNVHFVETMLGGNGTMFAFNDSQPWLTGWAICADLGSRFNQPLMLWMADKMAAQFAQGVGAYSENTRGDVAPYAFLYRSTTPAPTQFPGVPVISKLDTLNWGVMRNRGDVFNPELVIGIKGRGGVTTHHAEPDLGSFELDSRGERFFLDPGYYRPNANQHSLPLIDTTAPNATAVAPITTATSSGNLRYMVVDTTAAYGAAVQRSKRHYAMLSDDAIVILDDILPGSGKPGAVQSYFQAGFHASSLTNRSFVLQGTSSRMSGLLFGPSTTLVDTPQTWNANDWVYNTTGVTWESLAASYTADVTKPLISVFLPADSTGTLPIATVFYSSNYLTVDVPGADDLRFTYAPSTGWAFDKVFTTTATWYYGGAAVDSPNGSTTNWNTSGRWFPTDGPVGDWNNGNITTFGLGGTGNATITVNVPTTSSGLIFNAGTTYTISSIAGGLTLTGNITTNQNAVLDGAIVFGGPLSKDGAATLTLTGAIDASAGQPWTVNAGTLILAKSLTNYSGSVTAGTYATPATLQLGAAEQIATTQSVTLNRLGTFNLNGYNQTLQQLTLNGGGTVTSGAGILYLNNTNALTYNNTTNGSTANITANLGLSKGVSAGVRTFTINHDATLAVDVNLTGVISDGTAVGSSITKAGLGILVLSGSNSYSGGTTLTGNPASGTLGIGHNYALGTGNLNLSVHNNAANYPTLMAYGAARTIANNVVVTASNSGGKQGFLIGGTNNLTFNGTFLLSGVTNDLEIQVVNAGTVATITNGVTTSGTTGAGLVKSGLGTLVLGGTSSYTGATTLNAGTLTLAKLTPDNSFCTLNSLVINGGTFDPTNRDLLIPTGAAAGEHTLSTHLLAVAAPTGGSLITTTGLMKGATYTALYGNTFHGQPLGADALVLKYTVAGDANLDGTLSMDDYLATDAGYLMGGNNNWVNGDFNHDGVVNAKDYALIDFNNALLHPSSGAAMETLHTDWFGADYTNALADLTAAVPEPASVGLLALGALGLLARRRR